jgi:putative membrane protein PagO
MPSKIKIIIGYAAICLLWGTSWAAVKIGIQSIPLLLSLGFRFLIAGTLLGLIAYYRKIKMPKDKGYWKLAIYMTAFSFTIPFILIYWAQMRVDSGLASVLFSTFPLWVVLISHYLLKDLKIELPIVIGTLIAFIGIVMIFSNNINIDHIDLNQWLGMILIIIAAIMQASVLIVIKKYGAHIDPVSLNLWSMLLSAIIILFISLLIEDYSNIVINTLSISSHIYLSIFCTAMTFVIYYWLLKHMEPAMLSLSAFITPILAVIMGICFMSEELTTNIFAGIIFVLTGICLANKNDIAALFQNRVSNI